jgi:hypothetical protein
MMQLTYWIILAVYTFEIASREEDRPGPANSGNRRFLSEVEIGGGDSDTGAHAADAQLGGVSVNTAIPRAKIAVG